MHERRTGRRIRNKDEFGVKSKNANKSPFMRSNWTSLLRASIGGCGHNSKQFVSPDTSWLKTEKGLRRAFSTSIAPSRRVWAQLGNQQQSNQCSEKMSKFAPFARVQEGRPGWDATVTQSLTKTVDPLWSFGQGATDRYTGLGKKHIEIDPFAEGRSWYANYTLLISGIVPRPIGFVSTKSEDGKSDNLSPFSYFQVVDHDPPVFVIGFTGRAERPKDTLRNLMETRECTINVVSENFIEAVNASSVDAPHGISEWTLSGLHQAPSTTVKPARVQESIFSIEAHLVEVVNFKTSRASVKPHGCMAILEATRFWVREDALDEKQGHIDLNVLRPVAQLGGMSYGRITHTFELPRISWGDMMRDTGPELEQLIERKKESE